MGLMVIFPVYSHVFGGSLKIPLMIWWYVALTFVAVTFTKHFQVPKRYEHLYFCCMDTTLCKGVYPPPKYIGFRKPSIFRVPEILGEKACLQCYLHPTFLSCWGFGFRIYPHEDCQCSSPWVDFQSDIFGESQHCLNFWRESIPVNMGIILDFFFSEGLQPPSSQKPRQFELISKSSENWHVPLPNLNSDLQFSREAEGTKACVVRFISMLALFVYIRYCNMHTRTRDNKAHPQQYNLCSSKEKQIRSNKTDPWNYHEGSSPQNHLFSFQTNQQPRKPRRTTSHPFIVIQGVLPHYRLSRHCATVQGGIFFCT